MHKHHIMPRHLGGSNEPDNLIEVTVEEHAKIHHSQWILGGRWQDKVAWLSLSRQIGKEEIQKEMGRQCGLNNKGKLSKKKGKKGKKWTKEQRAKRSQKYTGKGHPLYGKMGKDNPGYGQKRPSQSAFMKEFMKGRNTWITGRHWYNNGVDEVIAFTCPDGFMPGRSR